MRPIRHVQDDARVFIDMPTSDDNPCSSCGVCCAHFRVSFYCGELVGGSGGFVPLEMTSKVNDFLACMKGTESGGGRCIALQGELGQPGIRCAIYANRPSPCREFPVWLEDGSPNPDCQRLRLPLGLPPLEPLPPEPVVPAPPDVSELQRLQMSNLELAQLLEDHRQLAQRLRESEQRLELAVHASGLGLWDYQLSTGEMSYDERWLGMLGEPGDTAPGRLEFWLQKIHPSDYEKFQDSFAQHLSGDFPSFQIEHRLRHREGHWVWVFANGKVVERDEAGRPLRLTGTLMDVSQQKRVSHEGLGLLQQVEALLRNLAVTSPAMENVTSGTAADPALEHLSRRQRQILVLIARGMTSREIAENLGIAPATAITHRRDVMRKLGLHSSSDVTRYAITHNLLKLD